MYRNPRLLHHLGPVAWYEDQLQVRHMRLSYLGSSTTTATTSLQ